jgi:hypothetical protein
LWLLAWGCFALLTAGCGGANYQPAPPSNPTQAKQTLTTVLDTWKSGASRTALASQSPKIYVGDEDWSEGKKLSSYQLKSEGESVGHSVRFQVQLEMETAKGRKQQKAARYIVVTDPVHSVTRDDRTE